MSPSQISNNLYVGDIDDARNGDVSEFDAIVTVCQDGCSDNISEDCEYSHFELRDGPYDSYGRGEFSYDLFEDAVDTVLSHRIRRQKVLVHCHAGVSRSAAVTTAALAVLENLTWNEAFEKVENARPNVNPNGNLVEFGERYVEGEQ